MKVIVLGGGVAGMSAAHELAERDFEVVVYETRAIPGGKARSMPVPDSGTRGRRDLPAEHGFRFFPGFYRHLPDTMKRIPFGGQSDGVLGNLVPTSRVQLALEGRVRDRHARALPVLPRRPRAAPSSPCSPTRPRSGSRRRTRPTSSTGCWSC